VAGNIMIGVRDSVSPRSLAAFGVAWRASWPLAR
jgi:hypothetical protein